MDQRKRRTRHFQVMIAMTIAIILLNLLLVTGVVGLSYEPFLWRQFASGYDKPTEFVYLPIVIKNTPPILLSPSQDSLAPVDMLVDGIAP